MEDSFSTDANFVDVPGVRIDEMARVADEALTLSSCTAACSTGASGTIRSPWFARNQRATRYDMIIRSPGASETTSSSEPFTHDEDLLRLLQALKIERVRLIASQITRSRFRDRLPWAGRESSSSFTRSVQLRGSDVWVGTKFNAIMGALGRQDLSGAVVIFLSAWVDGPYRTAAEVNPLGRERDREMVTRAHRLGRLAPNRKGLEPRSGDSGGPPREG
jgi:hypothetical protein